MQRSKNKLSKVFLHNVYLIENLQLAGTDYAEFT